MVVNVVAMIIKGLPMCRQFYCDIVHASPDSTRRVSPDQNRKITFPSNVVCSTPPMGMNSTWDSTIHLLDFKLPHTAPSQMNLEDRKCHCGKEWPFNIALSALFLPRHYDSGGVIPLEIISSTDASASFN